MPAAADEPSTPGDDVQGADGPDSARRAALICELYELGGWSTRRIAEALQLGRREVDRALRAAGVTVSSRGAGRARPQTRHRDPDDLAERLHELYVQNRLTRREISEKLGISEGLVRTRLAELGITTRTRGRFNREDRYEPDLEALKAYYQDQGLTASATGALLNVSHRIVLRTAHDHGIPVRQGSSEPEPAVPIELVTALYDDPLVRSTLARHGVPPVPAGGQIWQRFPAPIPLSEALCVELYVDCGVSIVHIELLTGQPSTAIRRVLRSAGTPMRAPGGRSPFLRRWRERHRPRSEPSRRGDRGAVR